MDLDAVPAALQERLGLEATSGLLQLLEQAHREGRAEVIAACAERFDRRLIEEAAGLRVQLAQVDASLRQEITTLGADLRGEITTLGADLRQEMSRMDTAIRQDMGKMEAGLHQDMWKIDAGLRQDIAASRVELLKWCFLFWIGQVVAITGIMGVLLRLFRY
jgi:hypothetical protein